MCMCVFLCVGMATECWCQRRPEVPHFLGLELQTVISYLVWEGAGNQTWDVWKNDTLLTTLSPLQSALWYELPRWAVDLLSILLSPEVTDLCTRPS